MVFRVDYDVIIEHLIFYTESSKITEFKRLFT